MWAAGGDIGGKIILTPSRPRQETAADATPLEVAGGGDDGAQPAQHARTRSRGSSTGSGAAVREPPAMQRAGSHFAVAGGGGGSASTSASRSASMSEAAGGGGTGSGAVSTRGSVSEPAGAAPAPSGGAEAAAPAPAAAAAAEAAAPTPAPAASAAPSPPQPQQPPQQHQQQAQHSSAAPVAVDPARAAAVARVLAKQTASATATTLRAIAHRAAAEMERSRIGPGREQGAEMGAYWASWAAHVTGVKRTNERLLAYARQSAAGAQSYALAMAAAAATLAPVATGEALVALPPELAAAPYSDGASGGGLDAACAVAHAAEKAAHAPTSAGVGALAKESAAAISTTAAAGPPSVAAGATSKRPTTGVAALLPAGAGVGGMAPGATAAAQAAGVPLPSPPLSLSLAASALVDMHAQTARVMEEVAVEVSRDVCGDADGPLGRRGDGASHGDARLAASAARLGAALADGTATPPRSLSELCAWYDALAGDVLRDGNALTDTLRDAEAACAAAFGSLEAATHAAITGTKAGGKAAGGAHRPDLWADELRYRRTGRLLLAAKARYVQGMGGLFERYRRIEGLRGEALALLVDRYATVVARAFERVTAKGATEAVATGGLTTHADFCRVVEADTKRRVEFLRAAAAALAASAAGAPGGSGAQFGHQPSVAAHTGGGGAYGGYAAPGGGGGAGSIGPLQHLRLSLDPLPAVISPLCSPLVARVGLLFRQSSVLKAWKQALAVLTRDGHLHVFNLPEAAVNAAFAAGAGAGAAPAGGSAPASAAGGAGGQPNSSSSVVNELGTHVDVLAAVARWCADRAAAGAGLGPPVSPLPGGEAAASTAGDGVGTQGQPGPLTLPPPALPPHLIASAAAHAAAIGDVLAAVSDLSSAAKGVAASAEPPSAASFALTPSTRIDTLPGTHPHAFELVDRSGWLRSTRLLLRGLSPGDVAEWVAALGAGIAAVAVASEAAQPSGGGSGGGK